MNQACPTSAELRSLVEGSLSDIEAQPLELHIDRCEACQRAIKDLVADGTFWKSAAKSLSDDKIAGPGLDRVMESLQHQSREEAEEIGEAIELKLSFIEPATEPGTIGRLRHYDILRVAGRGGMGIVLKAFDRSLRRIVAIKLLAPHLAGNGQARKRFVREGRAAAAICHDHVVTIHAVEESPPFLVMQYVHGETLESRIHRNGSLEIRDAVRIALQIAQGLAAAHAQGVVHRDIKPANILLENGVARVRITDFGLARAVDDASLTQSGVVSGTPQYMAPEQASGDAIDERADQFSLGSVLYTMLAGHAPFRATTAMGVLKRLCDNAARPIREINPETPDWLVVLLNRLHAKRPADRFQNVAEAAVLLERGLAALQNGTPMPDPLVSGENAAPQRSADVDSAPAELTSPITENAPANAVRQSSPLAVSSNLKTLRDRLRPPYPLWLLFAVVALLTAPFVPAASLLGAVFALIACLSPRFMPRITAKVLNANSTFNATPGTANACSWTSISFLRLLGWLLLWILPAAFWAEAFFNLEHLALSGSRSRLVSSDENIRIAAVVVFIAWLILAVLWFRQKNTDGASLFSSHVRRKGILTVAGLAAIFCACGYGTWESDVYSLASRRITSGNARYPMPGINDQQQFKVRIDIEEPPAGVRVIIDGDSGTQAYASNYIQRLKSPSIFNGQPPGNFVGDFIGKVGTYPWRAMLGQSKFASGEVTFAIGEMAVIHVPRPRLADLIAGRWESEPSEPGSDGPTPVEFEFHNGSVITANRSSDQSSRSDLQFQIDESVTPALITLTTDGDVKLPGIIRFEQTPDLGGVALNSSASMGPGPMSGIIGEGDAAEDVSTKDRLLICISEGGFLRPWQFQADPDHGISLFKLVRSQDAETLEGSLALEPLPIGTATSVVRESVQAWARRLDIPIERRNAIGMNLSLVPPAHFSLPPDGLLREQRILLPDGNAETDRTHSGSATSSSIRSIVSYPFVISRDVISAGQFRKFVDETNYVTDAERGELLSQVDERQEPHPGQPGTGHPAGADSTTDPLTLNGAKAGGWLHKDGQFVWQDKLSWTMPETGTANFDSNAVSSDESDNVPATVVSQRDATAFCEWLSAKENRQYRLPAAQEWTAALQLGAVRSGGNDGDVGEYRAWFDADKANPLGIKTSKRLFGEWTTGNVIVHQHLSNDGSRFDLSQQYIAPVEFRSSEISFRVVAELQTLTPTEATESTSDR